MQSNIRQWCFLALGLGILSGPASAKDVFSQQKHMATGAAELDFFGRAIGISGDELLIGAVGDDDLGSAAGSLQRYVHASREWLPSNEIHASDGSAGDGFGCAICRAADPSST
ncbi:MAG: hypothetical protein ACI841_003368 [Planctomycetota bacterium]|jgi:hypothetical protein